MTSFRSGKLYPRLLACFLAIVVFASVILAVSAGWFSYQSEEVLQTRIADNMETITSRLSTDMMTLFDLCGLISDNTLIKENFRPYQVLSVSQQYYYNAIIDMLWQSHLQFNGIVDSVFLYADGERVLYSTNEKGMCNSETFFSRVMAFEDGSRDGWLALLDGRRVSYQILPPDRYTTSQLSGAHPVVPIAHLTLNQGYPNVLVMNVSLQKIRALYEGNAIFKQTRFALYGSEGDCLEGEEIHLTADQINQAQQIVLSGIPYYLYSSHQPTLGITIVSLTPRSVFAQMSGYFNFLMIALPLVFAVCGVFLALILSRKMYEPFRVVHQSIPQTALNTSCPNELEAIKTSITALANDRQTFLIQSREHLTHYISQTLSALLSGRALDDEAYFTQLMMEEYGFTSPCCRVVSLVLDLDEPSTYLTIHEAMKRFSQIIQETFQGHGPLVRVHFRENMYVLVLSSQENDEKDLSALCLQTSQRVSSVLGLHASVRFGIGCITQQFNELSESFDAACSAIFSLLSPEEEKDAPIAESFHYDRREMIGAVSTCDVKLIEAACEDILGAAKRQGISYPQAEALLKDVFQTAASLRHKLIPDRPLPVDTIDPMAVLILSPRVNTTPLISALLPYLPRPSQTRAEDGMEKIAQRIKAFIDENYQQELSLDILAEKLGLSAKYLSRVFKHMMEVNLSDYLAYVRVEKIKELLLADLSLDQIAERVGITNRTTFTRTFRKLEGITPSEWRRIHQGQTILSLEQNATQK